MGCEHDLPKGIGCEECHPIENDGSNSASVTGLSCPPLIRSGLLKKDWSECKDGSWHHSFYKEDDARLKYYTWEEAVFNQFLMAT